MTRQRGVWRSRSRPLAPNRPYVDPNKPGSPQYAERHRRKVTEIMPGMFQVDIGSEGH